MNKNVSIIVTALVCVGVFLYMNMRTKNSVKGHIIILNGPSASGKSSVQKELQRQSKEMYITVGIDTFFDALLPTPDLSTFNETKTLIQKTNTGELIRSITLEHDGAGNPIIPLVVGSAGLRVIEGMHYAIAAYAHCGNNVIVDYILYDPLWKMCVHQALKEYNVYFVGFKFPIEVIEERETLRSTSPIGHARSHYSQVHEGMIYDIEITDSLLSAETIAQQILNHIKLHPKAQGHVIVK